MPPRAAAAANPSASRQHRIKRPVSPSNCSACEEPLTTPLGCHACGALEVVDDEPTPFAIFGRPVIWDIDQAALKKDLLALARLCHPDFHGLANSARQQLAEQHSARVNHAHEVLARPFLRADWIVTHLNGPSEKDERQMPQSFLMEVMEWNEQMEEADATPAGSPEREALKDLGDELDRERAGHLESIGQRLSPLPASGDACLADLRRELNAVRYLSRALWRIRELRLAEAEA